MDNNSPEIITLCGSTKFKDEFLKLMERFTLEGKLVFLPGVFGHSNVEPNEEQKTTLDKLHFKKIDLADSVFVVNKGGYIGGSTQKEIDYAKKINKKIQYLEPIEPLQNPIKSNKSHYVVATGMIIKDGKYLITKRADWEKAFPGKYTVPGGKLEVKDYIDKPKDTSVHWYNILEILLKREVKEETGLEIKNIKYLTSMTFIRPDNIPVLVVSLYADYLSGEVCLSNDMTAHAWVSLEEAKNYDLIEGIYEELEMLDNLLKRNKQEEWTNNKLENKNTVKISDRIYGEYEINEPIIIDLINSQALQRLKGIAQNEMPKGYCDYEPYSRFEHSLGVFILLRKLKADLKEQIAGLLHDISHTTFSHVADWVFGDPKNQDHQDNNYSKILINSDIPEILEKYGFDYKEFFDLEKYPLLEKEIPSLCADRIDYTLRDNRINKEFDSDIINDLTVFDNQIVFKSQHLAENFAFNYMKCQKNFWAGNESMLRYYILSNILKKAIKDRIIELNDFYKTDTEVLEKLQKSPNSEILNDLELLRNRLSVEESFNGEGVTLKTKFRYIDPEVLVENKVRRLSEISPGYYDLLEEEKRNPIIERKVVYHTP